MDAVEARLASIESKSEARDDELAEIREALATLLAEQSGLKEAYSRVEAKLDANQPPGLLALWGPALATTVAILTFGGYVLDKAIAPLKETERMIEDRLNRVQIDQKDLSKKQYETHGEVQRLIGGKGN